MDYNEIFQGLYQRFDLIVEDVKEAIAQGAAQDFSAYKMLVGQIAGVEEARRAVEELHDLMKRQEE